MLLVVARSTTTGRCPRARAKPGEPLPGHRGSQGAGRGRGRAELGPAPAPGWRRCSCRDGGVEAWARPPQAGPLLGSTVSSASTTRPCPTPRWIRSAGCPSAQAREHVSYSRDIGLVDEFGRLPAGTVPLILLRHAKAVAKSGGPRPNPARPLDDSGYADARAVAALLACFAPAARILAPPALRCLQTVRPYAELTGGTVQVAPALHIESSRTDGGAWPACVIADLIAAETPTVVCAHRENLPELLGAALSASSASSASPGGTAPPDPPMGGLPVPPYPPAPLAPLAPLAGTRHCRRPPSLSCTWLTARSSPRTATTCPTPERARRPRRRPRPRRAGAAPGT